MRLHQYYLRRLGDAYMHRISGKTLPAGYMDAQYGDYVTVYHRSAQGTVRSITASAHAETTTRTRRELYTYPQEQRKTTRVQQYYLRRLGDALTRYISGLPLPAGYQVFSGGGYLIIHHRSAQGVVRYIDATVGEIW